MNQKKVENIMIRKTKRMISLGEQSRRLTNRWTFERANYLISEHDVPRAEAFDRTQLVVRLLALLGRGRVTFVYAKTDGSERRAVGTLQPDCCPELAAYERKGARMTEPPMDTVTYWDIEACGWRSFKILRLVRIVDAVIK